MFQLAKPNWRATSSSASEWLTVTPRSAGAPGAEPWPISLAVDETTHVRSLSGGHNQVSARIADLGPPSRFKPCSMGAFTIPSTGTRAAGRTSQRHFDTGAACPRQLSLVSTDPHQVGGERGAELFHHASAGAPRWCAAKCQARARLPCWTAVGDAAQHLAPRAASAGLKPRTSTCRRCRPRPCRAGPSGAAHHAPSSPAARRLIGMSGSTVRGARRSSPARWTHFRPILEDEDRRARPHGLDALQDRQPVLVADDGY